VADMSAWLSVEPSQMLHAMDLLERRQFRSESLNRPDSAAGETLRIRTLTVGTVWFSLAIVVLAVWRSGSLAVAPVPVYVLVGLWGGWTIWLASLLRRLARS